MNSVNKAELINSGERGNKLFHARKEKLKNSWLDTIKF
jgi:hypothetical protein